MWSAACILGELYSGDLLFNAHHDEDHIAIIEKVAGPFPKWMMEKRKPRMSVGGSTEKALNKTKKLDVK